MSTITTKVCDRCGAAHIRDNTNQYPVQEVKWFVPNTNSLHITSEATKELCLPCRAGLSSLINTYVTTV